MRHRGVTMKLNPLREVVRGKRLTVVDDSIVRGHDDEADRRAPPAGRRGRGPRPDQRPADLPPVLLRDRHPGRDRADRGDPLGRGDPRVHRRRLARLPLDPRRPRRARPAVRPVLLRLLRRQLPGAGPVRRGVAEVRPRGGRAAASAVAEPRAAYAAAGVDVAAGERAVELMRAAVERDPPAGGPRRARRVRGRGHDPGRLSRAGPRLVDRRRRDEDRDRRGARAATTRSAATSSRCAPTTSCAAGAEPLFFLDYVAVGRLDPEQVAELVGGVAAGCRRGRLRARRRRDRRAPGPDGARRVRPRRVLRRRRRARRAARRQRRPGRRRDRRPRRRAGSTPTASRSSARWSRSWDLDLARPYQEQLQPDARRRRGGRGDRGRAGARAGDARRGPPDADTDLRRRAPRGCGRRSGPPATTSAGSPTSPAAACRATCRGRCRPGSAPGSTRRRWRMPSVMRLFGALGGLDDDELRATFNGGLGMVVVVAPGGGRARRSTRSAGDGIDARGRRRGRRRSTARRRALRRGAARRDERCAAGSPSAVSGAGLEPAGAPRGRRARRARRRDRPRRSPTGRARRSTGRPSRGSTRRSCPGGDDDDARRRRSRAPAPDVVVLAGYMRIVGPAVLARVRRAGSSTPTRACCRRSPAPTRSATRSPHGVRGHRRDRPPRRRDARRRPDRRPGGRRRSSPATTRRRSTSGSRRSSIGCCRGPSALLLAGALVGGRRARDVARRRRARRAQLSRCRAGRCCRSPTRPASPTLGRGPRRRGLRARVDRRHGPGAARRRACRSPTSPPSPAFPEMLDGRVKTLHPRVHAGILADRRLADHRRQLVAAGDRPVRARRRQPLPVRGGRASGPGSRSTSSSRRSTSAGRRWSGPRRRTTPASRS